MYTKPFDRSEIQLQFFFFFFVGGGGGGGEGGCHDCLQNGERDDKVMRTCVCCVQKI